jgi:hypothetical protein
MPSDEAGHTEAPASAPSITPSEALASAEVLEHGSAPPLSG